MRIHIYWGIACAALLVACSKEAPVEETAVETPAEAPPAVTETAPARPTFDVAFIDHMHLHADQMDELMYALDDGDLDAAVDIAKWISRHDAVERIPDDWLPYLEAMRAAARAVENANDVDTAREAAERISVHCQECHAAAGILSTD